LPGFRGVADDVKQGGRTEARHGGAEMLELIRSGWVDDALDHRDGPVVACNAPDHRAERAPFVERVGSEVGVDMQSRTALFGEMKAVARRASGQSGRNRGRSAFEIGERPTYRVGKNHHAGIAKGDMLVGHRRLDGLIIDAGIGHRHAESDESRNRAALQIEHRPGVTEKIRFCEIGAARIGNGWNAHLPLPLGDRRQPFQPAHAGFAEAFGIGHDVGLRHRHEIGRAKELAHLFLVLQRDLRKRAEFSAQNILLFVVELHQNWSFIRIDLSLRRNPARPCPISSARRAENPQARRR